MVLYSSEDEQRHLETDTNILYWRCNFVKNIGTFHIGVWRHYSFGTMVLQDVNKNQLLCKTKDVLLTIYLM